MQVGACILLCRLSGKKVKSEVEGLGKCSSCKMLQMYNYLFLIRSKLLFGGGLQLAYTKGIYKDLHQKRSR